MSEPFIGQIKLFASNFAPRGYAFCDGQLLPIATNTALFSILGTLYGGDGRTTFALPNLQDNVAMHPGRGPGLTNRRLAQRGGSSTVTLTETQIPSHNHQFNIDASGSNTDSPSNALLANSRQFSIFNNSTSSTTDMAAMIQPTGGSQSHNNQQPYLGINYIIALVGIYPSRS